MPTTCVTSSATREAGPATLASEADLTLDPAPADKAAAVLGQADLSVACELLTA
jgi:hypothetical protein